MEGLVVPAAGHNAAGRMLLDRVLVGWANLVRSADVAGLWGWDGCAGCGWQLQIRPPAETAGRPDVVDDPLVCWTCGYCPVWGGRWLDVDDLDAVAAVGAVAGEIVQSVLAGNEERQYEETAWWQDGNQN